MSQLTEGAAGYRKSETRGGSGGGYDSYDNKVGTSHSDCALISTCRVSFIPIKSGGLGGSVRSHFSKARGSAKGNISKIAVDKNGGARRCVREEKTVPPNDPGCGLGRIDLELDGEILTDAGNREGDILRILDIPRAKPKSGLTGLLAQSVSSAHAREVSAAEDSHDDGPWATVEIRPCSRIWWKMGMMMRRVTPKEYKSGTTAQPEGNQVRGRTP